MESDLVGLGSRRFGLNVGEIGQHRFLRNALDLTVYIILRNLHDHWAEDDHTDQVGSIIRPLKVSEMSQAREDVMTAPERIITTKITL